MQLVSAACICNKLAASRHLLGADELFAKGDTLLLAATDAPNHLITNGCVSTHLHVSCQLPNVLFMLNACCDARLLLVTHTMAHLAQCLWPAGAQARSSLHRLDKLVIAERICSSLHNNDKPVIFESTFNRYAVIHGAHIHAEDAQDVVSNNTFTLALGGSRLHVQIKC